MQKKLNQKTAIIVGMLINRTKLVVMHSEANEVFCQALALAE